MAEAWSAYPGLFAISLIATWLLALIQTCENDILCFPSVSHFSDTLNILFIVFCDFSKHDVHYFNAESEFSPVGPALFKCFLLGFKKIRQVYIFKRFWHTLSLFDDLFHPTLKIAGVTFLKCYQEVAFGRTLSYSTIVVDSRLNLPTILRQYAA